MSTPVKTEEQSFDLTPLLTPISIFLSAILISATLFFSLRGVTLGTTGTTAAAGSTSSAAAKETVTVTELDYQGGPVIGDANSNLVMVEYTDFQCPFCKRNYDQTYPSLKKDYIDTKKIAYISKNFPLDFHPSAQKSAEASECAQEQGKYWEMHDKMFGVSTSDGATLLVANLKQYARDLGLDGAKFDSCLDSGKYASAITASAATGQTVGVTGTPGFFVGTKSGTNKVKGFLVPGAYPYASFDTILKDIAASGVDVAAKNFENSIN